MAEQILVGSLAIDYGQLSKDIQEVNKILSSIGKGAKANADAVASKYATMTKEIAKAAKEVAKARQEMDKPQKTDHEKNYAEQLKKANTAYRDLTRAQNEYLKASKNGNSTQMNFWKNQIEYANRAKEGVEQQLRSYGFTEEEIRRIEQVLMRCGNAQDTFNKKTESGINVTQSLADNFDRMYGKIQLIAGISLAKIWRDALS